MTQIPYIDEALNATVGCSGRDCKCRPTCWAKGDHDKRHKAYLAGKKMPLQYAKPFHEVQFFPERLERALHWKKPRRIGISFTGDLFDEQVPLKWIDDIMAVIAECQQHQFFILTKQVKRMAGMLREYHIHNNTFLGVSICDQEDADTKIPDLLRIPGKHWISIEPMLSPVNLRDYLPIETIGGVEMEPWPFWIVIGAESGPKRRPCPHEWMIAPVEQCQAAQVPVWVKAVSIDGKVVHDINLFPKELQVRQTP